MFIVYILKSKVSNGYYIGYTTDIEKRLQYHNNGLNKSTRNKKPWILVYKEQYVSKSEALKREIFLKRQKNRSFYERLITGRSSDG